MQGGNRYYQLQVALKMLEKIYNIYTGTHCRELSSFLDTLQ